MNKGEQPAFASMASDQLGGVVEQIGLTKREYAAIHIMAAVVSSHRFAGPSIQTDMRAAAEEAVSAAAELFKALEG